MPTDISYSDGSNRPSVFAIREDLHTERAGYFRAFWSDKKYHPTEQIFRNGERIA